MRVMLPDSAGPPPVAMNVVVGGRGRNETPELASTLDMIVFSPTWRVPPRIIRDEIIPKALTDSMYLTRQGMELVRKGEVVPATPENLALVGDSIGVRQRPGDVNALGMVKFIFPNPYGVYLHDTPTKSTFRRANRAESHGCIRLADAPSLATWLLRTDSAWTAERMKEAMASPEPIDVTLGQGVPVRLVYETAVPREDGGVDFIADVYGRDRNMELALQTGYPYPSRQVPLVKKQSRHQDLRVSPAPFAGLSFPLTRPASCPWWGPTLDGRVSMTQVKRAVAGAATGIDNRLGCRCVYATYDHPGHERPAPGRSQPIPCRWRTVQILSCRNSSGSAASCGRCRSPPKKSVKARNWPRSWSSTASRRPASIRSA